MAIEAGRRDIPSYSLFPSFVNGNGLSVATGDVEGGEKRHNFRPDLFAVNSPVAGKTGAIIAGDREVS